MMIRNKALLVLFCIVTLSPSAFAIDLSQMSFKDITEKAEAGDGEAQYVLGSLYEEGIDVKRNTSEAVKWYLKAGEKGNKDAQLRLGEGYHQGFGNLEQNFEEAKKWYRKAADQNSALGQYNLASMLASNHVTKDSLKEALTLLQKSAEQEFSPAQIFLALLYANKLTDTKNNLFLAKYWLKKAADQGSLASTKLLRELSKKHPKLPLVCPHSPKFKICPVLGRYQNLI